jgi:hypothetical protein
VAHYFLSRLGRLNLTIPNFPVSFWFRLKAGLGKMWSSMARTGRL